MARSNEKMPTIANVEPDGSAVLKCPLGKTYDYIRFRVESADAAWLALTDAQRRAQLTNFGVEIDGTNQMPFKDANVLQAINGYYGRADVDNTATTGAYYVTIYFNRPELHDLVQQRMFGLGTKGMKTLAITFDIDAAAPADLKITARARKREGMTPGAIIKTRNFYFTSATAGDMEIDNILKGAPIMAMHFYKSTAVDDVAEVEVSNNDFRWVRRVTREELVEEQADYGRTAQDYYTHVDFCLEGDYTQALSTLRPGPNSTGDDFRQIIELANAGSGSVLVEYIDNAIDGVL